MLLEGGPIGVPGGAQVERSREEALRIHRLPHGTLRGEFEKKRKSQIPKEKKGEDAGDEFKIEEVDEEKEKEEKKKRPRRLRRCRMNGNSRIRTSHCGCESLRMLQMGSTHHFTSR